MGGGLSGLSSLLRGADDDASYDGPCRHLYCEKWGPGLFPCCDCHEKLTDPDRIEEEELKIDSIVDESVPEDGVNRGVTIEFLVAFADACNCWDMTTREVRRKFVMPATRASRCRFVELPEMSGVVGRAVTFVSHTWGAKFGDLVAALCDGGADRSRRVWVDIFAVRQWPSHKPDLDFSAVVRQCSSFMIVCSSLEEIGSLRFEDAVTHRNELIPAHVRCQVAFLRVWCLVEVHAAIINDVTIVMKGGSRGSRGQFEANEVMLEKLIWFIDIESAEATVAVDKERILNDIRSTTEGGVEAVNLAIRGVVAGSRFSVMKPEIQCAACGDEAALNVLLESPSEYIISVTCCGYLSLLKKLIDAGADIEFEDEDGMVPLNPICAAAFGGHIACLKFLLDKGIDINSRVSDGYTPLILGSVGGNIECIKLLLELGGDVHAKSIEGTALMMAAATGQVKVCELLLDAGSDVKVKVSVGTVLHCAVMSGKTELVKLFVQLGADVSVLNRDNKTALEVAEDLGYTECIEVLRSASVTYE